MFLVHIVFSVSMVVGSLDEGSLDIGALLTPHAFVVLVVICIVSDVLVHVSDVWLTSVVYGNYFSLNFVPYHCNFHS